jgi:signal transduction histidine kinase
VKGPLSFLSSLSVEGALDAVDDRHRTYIYRIVQEALTNCAKHARASRIGIVLQRRDEEIGVTITDDGAGFVPTSMAVWGLLSHKRRFRKPAKRG